MLEVAGVVARVDDDDLALEGPAAAGRSEAAGVAGPEKVEFGGFPSSVPDALGVRAAAEADPGAAEEAPGAPEEVVDVADVLPPPPESPTACHTSHPTSAPGTSAATATVIGPRRERRGPGGSKSGPTYDTSATLTALSDPRSRSPQDAQ